MTINRRHFLGNLGKSSLFAALSTLSIERAEGMQLIQANSLDDYKAIVVITLRGGNDGNNTVIPLNSDQFSAYTSLRQYLALDRSSILPLTYGSGSAAYGLHPGLQNIANLYNSGRALVAANIGPIYKPSLKAEIANNIALYPGGDLTHTNALAAWERAQDASTGWGGRVADCVVTNSGSLPPVLTTTQSDFTVGRTVQAVAVQGGSMYAVIPPALTDVLANIAQTEKNADNALVAATAQLRTRALASQQLLNQAASYNRLKTVFGQTQLQQGLKTIAQLIAGRSVIGASRQIFHTEQGGHDTHVNQLAFQMQLLSDLDQGIAAFLLALDEAGVRDKVLICTHSDFSRTLQPNTSGGTDHAWGNHHFIIGEGINGGRVAGSMPDMELNSSSDMNGYGCWIPTQSVTQMTAGICSWFGLTPAQVTSIFPDLKNFPAGPIQLS